MQRREGPNADPVRGSRIRDRDIVYAVRQPEKQLHPGGCAADLEPRQPLGYGANEAIAPVAICIAGADNVSFTWITGVSNV